jgi:hypothetical protein
MARLRNEELEEELVKYKLLYSNFPYSCALGLKSTTVTLRPCMRTRTPCRLIACHLLWLVEGEVATDDTVIGIHRTY